MELTNEFKYSKLGINSYSIKQDYIKEKFLDNKRYIYR